MATTAKRSGDEGADDPIERFRSLLAEAEAIERSVLPEPTAMMLGSVGDDGRPSLRVVLLKSVDERGFVFYTNYESRKGRELLANPDRARFNFAPDFQATTAAGAPISLHQFAGKVVVLDFWATWCPPCRSSVPELKELSKKYSGDQLQLISISADSDREKWQGYIAKKKMDWPQIWDSNSAIRNAFGVSSFPTYLVIDRKGIIQQRIVGLNPQQTIVARLKQELAKMLE